MNYAETYLRNIGLFTEAQQQKLRDAKITLAGVGGVGGIQAATLARMGIGAMTIMDPGVFDAPDMNRQYAAMQSTIGQNKARATAAIIRDINPHIRLQVREQAPSAKSELLELIRGSSLVIDAIDYSGFDYKAMFAEAAREIGAYNLTAPIPDFGTLLMIFDPNGMTLEEFYEAPEDKRKWPAYDIPLLKRLGIGRSSQNLTDFTALRRPYIASNAAAAALSGAVLAHEAAMIITGLRPPADIVCAPRATFVDLMTRKYEVYDAFAQT